MGENIMKFGDRSYVFRDDKLYRYKLVSFRDEKVPEYDLVYDPAVDSIEVLYHTFEEIFIAGNTHIKNKFKDLLK